ncbi:methyltransferase [Bosea sp. BK604]|uniref:methyltransferase family protein n=1 Tax=Bosea sp. BK604 TaxID=2512180 RepID=UPI00104D9D65|nr:methyltransferase [Bosea sp. BK604]TCR70282.1 phospholipid methyltransferase [Bosea sp. BK604]
MTDGLASEFVGLARAALLLGPALLSMLLLILIRSTPRQATAVMLAALWQLPALLLLNLVATLMGWWRFQEDAAAVLGLPIDLWLGWSLWWGPVAVLASRKLPWWLVVAGMVAADLVSMPLLKPLVVLGEHWLIGEAAAVLFVLLPALVLARLTEADERPVLRTCFHGLGWGGYMLLVLPACVLAWEGRDYLDALAQASPLRWGLALAVGLPSLLIGWAAAHEFALVGRGTPVPYDPPKRVVTSGPYATIANPMQVTSALVMASQALLVGSTAAWTIPLTFLVFDGIFAAWYNRAHIALALPEDWQRYRAAVGDWLPRRRPYVAREAVLHFPDAGRDARVLAWLMRHAADGLTIEIGPSQPTLRRQRLIYASSDPDLDAIGIAALGRALEHLGTVPALIGWTLRLPGVNHLVEFATWLLPLRRLATRGAMVLDATDRR